MILAIDQSLSDTGVCYISRAGRIHTRSVKTSAKMSWLDRVNKILSALDSCFLYGDIEKSPVEQVVMEGYAFGGSTKGFVLGELGGVIKYFLGIRGMPVYQVVASHHKMYVANNGHADKRATMRALRERFAVDVSNDNIADAIAMALLCRHMRLFDAGVSTASLYEKNLFAKVRSSFELQERNPEELERRRIARKEKASKRRRKAQTSTGVQQTTGECSKGTKGGDTSDPFEVR